MSYNPVPGRDIRVTLDREGDFYVVEQERTRTANGTTNPNDLGAILDLDEVAWERRFESRIIAEVFEEVFSIAYQEDAVIRSIDLGPISLTDPAVVGALNRLALLTL